MKHILIIMLVLLSAVSMLVAQQTVTLKKSGDESNLTITVNDDELIKEVDGKIVKKITFKAGSDETGVSSDAAFFGFYVEDITFPKAQALNYKDNFGIVITGVTKDGPAWEYRLLEDDIIMKINDDKVTNKAAFDKILAKLRAGDQITLELFRSGKVVSLEMVVGSRKSRVTSLTASTSTKKKLSSGYGGGTWLFMGFQPDMEDVNNLLNQMGYDEMSEDGLFMTGIAGKGPVGKGFFIGGYAAGMEDTQKKPVKDANNNVVGTKWLNYSNSVGGVTFDKRIPVTSKFITSMGLMLGGGMHSLEITKTDGDYAWDTLGDDTNFTNYTLSRGYIVVQPRAELYYRLLGWLALRAEVGYIYGYAPSKSWKINGFSGDQFDVANSPETEYQGLTVSIGPWFGF